jgi:hypothetical protein
VTRFIGRFVVMSRSQLLVNALWAIHTHLISSYRQTPYLLVTSPEPECGKSRLLEVHELLVRRPWSVVNPSEAVLFRKIDADTPTLLWDEIDAIFNPKSAGFHEDKRAVLDQGHRRHGRVPRFINNVVAEFNVYGAKIIAGIGTVPDTIAARSIPIRLERRKAGEQVEDFILRDVETEAKKIRSRIERWAKQNAAELRDARPEMPDELSDRMKEGCEPLVGIADLLGCGRKARAALVELLTADRLDEQETMRRRLLHDIRDVFSVNGRRAMRTPDMIARLAEIEEAPWGDYYGRGLAPKDLASLLRPYGVRPKPIKFKNGEVHKGYRRDELSEVWERYLDAEK